MIELQRKNRVKKKSLRRAEFKAFEPKKNKDRILKKRIMENDHN